MGANKFVIKQISVFSENKPGRLAAIARALQDEKINILAFSIAEADGFGVVRALVDDPQRAYEKLTKMEFNVAFTDVIAVQMKDEPGGLYEVAEILGRSGINIEYAYAYTGRDGAVLILRVDNIDAAIEAIQKSGAKLHESSLFQ
jgi:hypothetical protein